MRLYRHPTAVPPSDWYLLVYTRAVKRLVGVLVVTVLLYRFSVIAFFDSIVPLTGRHTYGHYVARGPDPNGETILSLPFSLEEPIPSELFQYVWQALTGWLAGPLFLMGLLALVLQYLSAR